MPAVFLFFFFCSVFFQFAALGGSPRCVYMVWIYRTPVHKTLPPIRNGNLSGRWGNSSWQKVKLRDDGDKKARPRQSVGAAGTVAGRGSSGRQLGAWMDNFFWRESRSQTWSRNRAIGKDSRLEAAGNCSRQGRGSWLSPSHMSRAYRTHHTRQRTQSEHFHHSSTHPRTNQAILPHNETS